MSADGHTPPVSPRSLSISWVNPDTGYILTGEGAAAGSIPTDLYRTGDGGRCWTLVAYNHLVNHSSDSLGACGGAISFANPQVGTAAGSCGAAPQFLVLYRTTDCGRSWRRLARLPFASPPELDFPTPRRGFALGMDGAVNSATWVLRATADGGRTWRTLQPKVG